MEIGDERFGPSGTHWGAQINLIGSTVDHLIDCRGGEIFDTIELIPAEDVRDVIWDLVTRYRILRGDFGGGQDPVV